jgi:hypothetical protein
VLVFGGTGTSLLDIVDPTYMGPGNSFLVTAVPADGTTTVGVPMPTAGTLSNLQISIKDGPATIADVWTFTVCVNEDCAQALSCTITGTGFAPPTLCSDNIDTVNYAAGDRLTVQAVPSGSVTSTSGSFSGTFAP